MRRPKLSQGLVQVYTGNGKGKTTAALGLALRAAGQGLKVHLIQFMKGGGPYGEHLAAERLFPRVVLTVTGRDTWVTPDALDPEDIREARRAMDTARETVREQTCDVLILDEINGALDFGLLELDEVLQIIDERPPQLELVLTGRNLREEIAERADLISEVREVKHYFSRGVPARQGIEC